MPGPGIQCNQPYLLIICGRTRHNQRIKESCILCSISSQFCLLFFFWFLINMTPWSRTIHVLRLLPLTFILSITMAENDLLMDIHVQFQKMSSQSVCSRGLIIFLDLVSSCLKHHCFIFFAMDLIPSSVSLCNT